MYSFENSTKPDTKSLVNSVDPDQVAFLVNSVDPDQLASSDQLIRTHTIFNATYRLIRNNYSKYELQNCIT